MILANMSNIARICAVEVVVSAPRNIISKIPCAVIAAAALAAHVAERYQTFGVFPGFGWVFRDLADPNGADRLHGYRYNCDGLVESRPRIRLSNFLTIRSSDVSEADNWQFANLP